jgi:hypothetical protein
LANRPDGRATLDEVKRESGAFTLSEIQTEQLRRFPEIGEIDIFKSGLVFRDNGCLQITNEGRSLLHSLESTNVPVKTPTSPSLEMIDDLIGIEKRQQIFDLELREPDREAGDGAPTDPDPSRRAAEGGPAAEMAGATSEQDGAHTNEITNPETFGRTANKETAQPHSDGVNRADAIGSSDAVHRGHPSVVPLPGFRSTLQDSDRKSHRRAGFFATLTAKTRSVAGAWRGHFEQAPSKPPLARTTRSMGAATSAFLTFVTLVACGVAVIALAQTKSLKTETATLDRELGVLRERLVKLERAEKTRLMTEQQEAGQKSAADKDKSVVEPRADQAALSLSRDEIQLVREYIKPAPAAGPPAPVINVGDPISWGTIPLPSSLTEKVPKLLGARFATRNGSIIIVKRDSRQADAVLAPN